MERERNQKKNKRKMVTALFFIYLNFTFDFVTVQLTWKKQKV